MVPLVCPTALNYLLSSHSLARICGRPRCGRRGSCGADRPCPCGSDAAISPDSAAQPLPCSPPSGPRPGVVFGVHLALAPRSSASPVPVGQAWASLSLSLSVSGQDLTGSGLRSYRGSLTSYFPYTMRWGPAVRTPKHHSYCEKLEVGRKTHCVLKVKASWHLRLNVLICKIQITSQGL